MVNDKVGRNWTEGRKEESKEGREGEREREMN